MKTFYSLLVLFIISTNFAFAEDVDFAKKAVELVQINDTKGAIKLLSDGIVKQPKDIELYSIRGPLLGRIGRKKEALRDYNEIIRLAGPKTQKFFLAGAYYNRAIVESNDRMVKKAELDFKKAIEIDPELGIAYIDYGQFLIEQKRATEAVLYLEKGKKIVNGAAPKEALDRIERLLEKARSGRGKLASPARADADSALKKVNDLLGINENDKAISVLNDAIKAEPKNAELYSMRGPLLASKKQLKAAMNDHNKVIDLASKCKVDALTVANAYLNKGLVENRWNHSKAAESNFKKAIDTKPDFFLSHLEYAKFLMNQKKTNLAVSEFQKAKDFAQGHTTTERLNAIDKLLNEAKTTPKSELLR